MSQPSAKETPCPDCGEMVRVNSLRCWNCGAFMNSAVEQRYMAMQANPSPIILSEVPEGEMTSMDDADATGEDEDDFRLNASVTGTRPAAPAPTPAPAIKAETEDAAANSFLDEPEEGAADPQPAQESKRSALAPEEGAVAHSVATGGDALLDIAMQEEREVKQRQKGRRHTGVVKTAGGGLIIFCPYGCKVEVKEQHRGMTGKCPRCGAPFIVPVDPPQYKKSEAPAAAAAASTNTDKFKSWVVDLHLHVIEPEKLKLKADSLLKEFVEADLGFSPEQLVVAILTKKAGGGGLFAKGGGEKKETVRENMLAHLKEDKPVGELPVGERYLFTPDEVAQIRVVQPTANRGTSVFHGIPVFGTGRIAVQLPLNDKLTEPTYLSMGITEFWKFAKAMEETYGISGLGLAEGIPMEAKTSVSKCHFSDMLVKSIDNVEMFQADPTAQLEVVAYRCGACKTVVSEAARKKENLGGKSPKGIAKAKCPKCSSKMGENLLYALKQDVSEPSMSEATS
ncbi:hypothetical protein SH661x_003669 [Planctomicrobium sp. SH661]|uniref:hypothetical protein n=1 Tax=Planctomicrobium sp. SH661 TaxID=3448124 RepID=UPI003F5B844F